MNPEQPQDKPEASTETQEAKDQKYADSLAKMAALDYQLTQKQQPEQKHFISKKWLIYIAISTIVTIISLIVMAITSRNKSTNLPSSNQSEQLLKDTVNDVKEFQEQ